jgi:polyhydroxyalkanoate synthase
MEQINNHEAIVSTTKIPSIIEKIFTLLGIYKTIIGKDIPIELLNNNELYNLSNQLVLKFIAQPESIIKSLLLYNQNLYNQNNYLYEEKNVAMKLLHGLDNFFTKLIYNNGHLSLSMIDKHALKLGVDLATTPGRIVYQNELMQLIQYLPTTNTIYASPILFIPPWINKYYVLDLKQENSMVKWLIAQGFTVFMISWINPSEHLSAKCWKNYLLEGPIAALDFITKITNAPVHTVGYCIGGTLLSCVLAYLQYQADNRIISASYFNSLLDFTQVGELKTFINSEQLNWLDYTVNDKGYLDGRLLDFAFNMLRPHESLWSSFINHYLLEQKTDLLDVLFWNADSTNLPKEMFNFYIDNMYLNNLLKIPGGITLNTIPIDLAIVTTPTFFVAAEKDHIVPWQSNYAGVHMHKSNAIFVLSGSGHVISIINSPMKNKYGFKSNNYIYNTHEQWLQTSKKYNGSWWPYWSSWLIKQNPKQISAKQRLIAKSSIIEDAPGSYVLKRI